jgi:AcrR family transcriptional regulator
MARPRDQSQRRDELVEAATTLIAQKGMLGVRLRDVADAAGITPGAVLYYYGNLDQLFAAAYNRAIERFCAERERVVAGIADPAEQIATAIRLAIPRECNDVEIRLLYELGPVAFRDESCAALIAGYIERQVVMYAAILEAGAAGGLFTLAHSARAVARNIISLEDGQGLYVLLGHDEPAEVERRIFDYLASATGMDRAAFGAQLGAA